MTLDLTIVAVALPGDTQLHINVTTEPWDLSTFFDVWLRRTVKPTEW